MVSLGMRRLPMTRMLLMVSALCAKAETAVKAAITTSIKQAARRVKPTKRDIKVCLIFTGQRPCGEHKKYWCGPWFGFTERICTPSLLKIVSCIEERLIIFDRTDPAQTAGANSDSRIAVPRIRCLEIAGPPGPRRQVFACGVGVSVSWRPYKKIRAGYICSGFVVAAASQEIREAIA